MTKERRPGGNTVFGGFPFQQEENFPSLCRKHTSSQHKFLFSVHEEVEDTTTGFPALSPLTSSWV